MQSIQIYITESGHSQLQTKIYVTLLNEWVPSVTQSANVTWSYNYKYSLLISISAHR